MTVKEVGPRGRIPPSTGLSEALIPAPSTGRASKSSGHACAGVTGWFQMRWRMIVTHRRIDAPIGLAPNKKRPDGVGRGRISEHHLCASVYYLFSNLSSQIQ